MKAMLEISHYLRNLNFNKNMSTIFIATTIILTAFILLYLHRKRKKSLLKEEKSQETKTQSPTSKTPSSSNKQKTIGDSLQKTSSNWIHAFKKILPTSQKLDPNLENKLYRPLFIHEKYLPSR